MIPIDYLQFLRVTAHEISRKNLEYTFPEEIQDEPVPVVIKIKPLTIYFDKNNRFNMLADAY